MNQPSGRDSRGLRVRRVAGLALLAVSALLLAWSLWPVPLETAVIDLPSGEAGSAEWRITLVWPGRVRLGEAAEVRLEVSSPSPRPAAQASSLAARLELPGLAFAPTGEATQPAPAEQRPVVFLWYLRPGVAGEFDGAAWLHRLPDPSNPTSRQVLSAQRLRVQAVGLLGLNAVWAQALGLAGSVLGAVFGLDGVFFWFWRRFIIQ